MNRNETTKTIKAAERAAIPQGEEEMKTEKQARSEKVCVCGRGKDHNGIVCWICFKYCPIPFKYFQGTFEEWQVKMRFSE